MISKYYIVGKARRVNHLMMGGVKLRAVLLYREQSCLEFICAYKLYILSIVARRTV